MQSEGATLTNSSLYWIQTSKLTPASIMPPLCIALQQVSCGESTGTPSSAVPHHDQSDSSQVAVNCTLYTGPVLGHCITSCCIAAHMRIDNLSFCGVACTVFLSPAQIQRRPSHAPCCPCLRSERTTELAYASMHCVPCTTSLRHVRHAASPCWQPEL